jgi:hypothetical protein
MLTHEEPLWPEGSIRLYDDGHLEVVGASGSVRRHQVADLGTLDFGRPRHGRIPLKLRFKGSIGSRGVRVLVEEATLPAMQGLAAAALADRDDALAAH